LDELSAICRSDLSEGKSRDSAIGINWDKESCRRKDCTPSLSPSVLVGIKEVQDDIWLVSFMHYDLGYFDLETRVLEPLENPFGPKVLPMS
jgi:hypothetical protein